MSGHDHLRRQCTMARTQRPMSSRPSGAAVMPACAAHGNGAMAEHVAALGPGSPGYGVLLDPEAPPLLEVGPEYDPESRLTPLPGTGDIASQPTQHQMDRETMTPAPSASALARQNDLIEHEREQRLIRRRREINSENRRAMMEDRGSGADSVREQSQASLFGEEIGPYRFSNHERPRVGNMGGDSGGFGLAHGRWEHGGFDLGMRHVVGHGTDLDGNDEYGIHVQGGLTGDLELPGGTYQVEGGAANFDAGLYFTNETATVGAQANAVEGVETFGPAPDPEGSRDTTLSLGRSIGPGAAGRLHYGDADGDGVTEFGLGVSWLGSSLDVRSEIPHAMYQAATGADSDTEPSGD